MESCTPSEYMSPETACDCCQKIVDANTLRKDHFGEMSCQSCRDVQGHFFGSQDD